MRARSLWALSLPAALLLALFFVGPLALLVRTSLFEGGGRSGFGIGASFYTPGTWTTGAYRALLADSTFRSIALFTLQLAVGVTALSVVLGYPIALFVHRLTGWRRGLALAAVVLPKLANVLVIVYGLVLLMGTTGPVRRVLALIVGTEHAPELHHNLAAVVIGKTYLMLPYTVLVLVVALDRVDPDLATAARGLGASRWQVWRRVTLPLSLPGAGLAALLSLLWGLGAFVTPFLMGSPDQLTLAVQVQRTAFEHLNWPGAAATAVMLTAGAAMVVVLWRWLVRPVIDRVAS